MKVDFSRVIIKDIDGNDITADFQKQIGNQLYMTGRNITECELGQRIYHADGAMELTDKECEIVRNVIAGYSYVARTGIEKLLTED